MPYKHEAAGSIPAPPTNSCGTRGEIAQMVEQRTENPCVPSSILGLATNRSSHPGRTLMVAVPGEPA